jgi:hypothetical protein
MHSFVFNLRIGISLALIFDYGTLCFPVLILLLGTCAIEGEADCKGVESAIVCFLVEDHATYKNFPIRGCGKDLRGIFNSLVEVL